jgi:hypothetical protein
MGQESGLEEDGAGPVGDVVGRLPGRSPGSTRKYLVLQPICLLPVSSHTRTVRSKWTDNIESCGLKLLHVDPQTSICRENKPGPLSLDPHGGASA